jgi:MoxR-like ATPase
MMSQSFESLSAQSQGLRSRINRFRESLGLWFTEKQEIIDLMTVCAVAQEPLLLVGPPGTAKSDLVGKFKEALGVPNADYFEYMLTRFTEPSEIFGPIDIEQLREGRYLRRFEGKLPTASVAFLDEVFKSNSAILNALLTLINERKTYQDGKPVSVPLKILFAATNTVPQQEELAALRDRFVLHAPCEPVSDASFMNLLDAGLTNQTHRDLKQRPWAEGHASLEDLMLANQYLSHCFQQQEQGTDGETLRDRDRFFPTDRMREFRWIIQSLRHEDGVFISDRSIIKLYRLVRTRAWITHGGAVERDDLRLLACVAGGGADVRERVEQLLGLPA